MDDIDSVPARILDTRAGGQGLLRLYIAKMTGLSRRKQRGLITRYQQSGTVYERSYRRNQFPNRHGAHTGAS